MSDTKSIFLSKTMWLNAASLVLILVNRTTEIIDPAVAAPFAVVAVAAVNLVLRYTTKTGVHVLKGTGDGGPQ